MKIATIIGARPQFIKASVVSRKIKEIETIEEIIIHTGQHFDSEMSEIFFKELDIPEPKYNLGINNLIHGAMTGRMIEEIEKILISESPDWVIVYGNTNSTLAAAIASKKLQIKLAHVEAGLRSFNMKMPEEINRILTDRISDLLLCPTEKAIENLHLEGFANFESNIVNTGDVMFDSVKFYTQLANRKSNLLEEVNLDEPFVLCAIHREENTTNKKRLSEIIEALEVIDNEIKVICPIHPRTKSLLHRTTELSTISFIKPVGYIEMQALLSKCNFVLTDSGGLQKEAFFHNKKCFILRDETEWTELVECGANEIVGASKERIIKAIKSFERAAQPSVIFEKFYGDGDAAKKVMESIINFT